MVDEYGRPTSGDEIVVVETPIGYIRAGERLLARMLEEQREEERVERTRRGWLGYFGIR